MHIPEGSSAGMLSLITPRRQDLVLGTRGGRRATESTDCTEHPHLKGSCCLPALAFRVPTRASKDFQMVARQPILWREIRTSVLPTSQG